MFCSRCQSENPADAKYCENCGQVLLKVLPSAKDSGQCPSCGEKNSSKDNFCQKCGAALNKLTSAKKRRAAEPHSAKAMPREERYHLARQLALQRVDTPSEAESGASFIYIGEKIT